jgi:myo-inositol-1(or 4)-monophosphatase
VRDFTVGTKASHRDLVTDVDHASERAIVSFLRARRPEDPILAEESGLHEGSGDVRWLVDPLDGTMNFVHGFPEFAVAVAAESAGRISAGAIIRPAYQDWMAAGEDELTGAAATPSVSGTRRLGEALIAVGVSTLEDRRPLTFGLLAALLPEISDFRRLGSSSCELFAVASGSLDAYVGIETAPWDIAPGWALVRAAGGHCERFSTRTGHTAYVLGTPAVVGQLAPLVERHA